MMQQFPQYIPTPMPVSQQFVPMPYYFPVMPMQPGIQPVGIGAQPLNTTNINPNGVTNQAGLQQDQSYINGEQKRRTQSQDNIAFEDILDREKFKFESAKNNNKKGDFLQQQDQFQPNIFKPGNHNNHFNPKSMTDILQDKQKKNQYAEILNQQMKIKRDLDLEKKSLDTKHNIHLFFERQKNDLKSYNMPIRDAYGNILQTRGQPGNKNYQIQDWFTHVPNINRKFAEEDDIQLVDQLNNGIKATIANPHTREFNAFQQQQQALVNFEEKDKKNLVFNFSNDQGQSQQIALNQNQGYYRPNHQVQQHAGQNTLDYSQYHQNENYNYDDEEEDHHRVRIVTPTKYRRNRSAKGTQTPHNQDELNQLTNQEIGDLYPSLKSQHELSYVPAPQQHPLSYSMNRLPTSQPQTLSVIPSSLRFTQYLKGDFKYANDIDKMRKREQYIQLQNEQMNQMEEKKRQKELQKIQEQRERDLDDLRVKREAQIISEKFLEEVSGQPFDKKNLRESYVSDLQFNKHTKNNYNIYLPDFESQNAAKSSKKRGKRPRTPLEDAVNPFHKTENTPKSSKNQEGHLIIQEIPYKVKEQVGDAVNEQLQKLRSEMRASQGFVQNELQSIKNNLSNFNQQKQEQEYNQNILATEINKTRLVDEIRRRELDQKVRDRERKEQEEIDAELAQALLANPGYARYDLQNQKKVFFDYDDQYAFNPDRINTELGSILKNGELPSQKILVNYNNGGASKPNFLTYDDGFSKTSQEILSNQQLKIEQRLNKMGLSNLEQPQSQSLLFQNYSTAADLQSSDNYNTNYKRESLAEINKPSAANSDVDDIYVDLIKGNKENSNVFKNQRDNDKFDIEDFAMWNSKNARYR